MSNSAWHWPGCGYDITTQLVYAEKENFQRLGLPPQNGDQILHVINA